MAHKKATRTTPAIGWVVMLAAAILLPAACVPKPEGCTTTTHEGIKISLSEGGVENRLISDFTYLHAECHEGKLGFFLIQADQTCNLPVTFTSTGGWGCHIYNGPTPVWTYGVSSTGWVWPNGHPLNFQEPPLSGPEYPSQDEEIAPGWGN